MAAFLKLWPRHALTRSLAKTIPLYRGRRRMSSAVLNLRPTDASQRQWFDVLQKSPGVPRSVVIDTYPDPYYTSNRSSDWGIEGVDYCFEPGDEFYRALSTLHKFPNVNDISLRFTSDCFAADTGQDGGASSPAEMWVIENSERRAKILDVFFTATSKHCNTSGNQRLQTLTVRNLQNTCHERVTETDDFRETIRNLTALHLQICTEWNEDYAYMMEDMHTFWPHLRSQWLEPLANQLEALTLYWDTRWGLFPPMGFGGLHFPRLRSLSLGTYVFGLDEQMRWLLSHKTLQYLSLDACTICSKWKVPDPSEYYYRDELRMARANLPLAVPFNPEAQLAEPGEMWEFKYDGRWPRFFERMAKELSELKRLQFCDLWDPWGEENIPKRRQDTRFEGRHSFGADFKYPPYVNFVPGMGGDGFEYSNFLEVYGCKEDEEKMFEKVEKQALDVLLRTLQKRCK